MVTVFIRHKVADFDAWKKGYDADSPTRDAAGIQEVGIYHENGDENMIIVAMSAPNADIIKGMLSSPELKEKMQQAGVISKPEVWLGESLG